MSNVIAKDEILMLVKLDRILTAAETIIGAVIQFLIDEGELIIVDKGELIIDETGEKMSKAIAIKDELFMNTEVERIMNAAQNIVSVVRSYLVDEEEIITDETGQIKTGQIIAKT